MPLELLGEEALAEGQGLVLVGPVEARAPPGVLGRLEDERRHRRVVSIGVDAPETVGALLEQKRERRIRKRRAEPDELVGSPVDLRPEMLGIAAADDAVHAVGAEHEVGVGVVTRVDDITLELEPHAELGAAPLEDVEQDLARHPGEAVAGRGQHLPAVVDLDVVPVGEVARDLGVALAIGRRHVLERRVGEHDAESKVSSGRFRSTTVTSWAGSDFFMSRLK